MENAVEHMYTRNITVFVILDREAFQLPLHRSYSSDDKNGLLFLQDLLGKRRLLLKKMQEMLRVRNLQKTSASFVLLKPSPSRNILIL